VSQPAKTWCLVLVVVNVLLLALLSRPSWPHFTSPSQVETEDCGNYNEAIQVGQETARQFLLANEAESVVIDRDVSATLFKRTGIWTLKGFAASEDSRKFRWVVILAYQPGEALADRWEIVGVTARLMDKESRTFSQDSSGHSKETQEFQISAKKYRIPKQGIASLPSFYCSCLLHDFRVR
jgi:hypothetical protein